MGNLSAFDIIGRKVCEIAEDNMVTIRNGEVACGNLVILSPKSTQLIIIVKLLLYNMLNRIDFQENVQNKLLCSSFSNKINRSKRKKWSSLFFPTS